MKTAHTAIVHEGEFTADKGVAVKLYDGRARCCGAHVREDAGAADDTGEVKEVYIVPRRGNILKERGPRRDFGRIPGKAKAVSVKGFFALMAVEALVDNGVFRLRDKGAD